jgi:nicotinate-nucleotide adenylyltransferase
MDLPPSRGPRVAFFGGSFDPPHQGHIAVAQAAQQALALDTILFAPVGTQPLKPQGSTVSFAHRLAMTRLAIATNPSFAVSMVDAPKPSAEPNYTLETLLKLRAELPSEGTLFCLTGADSFAALRHWHRAAEIPFVAPLIVASRPGQHLDDLSFALPNGLKITPQPDSIETHSGIELQRFSLCNPEGSRTPFYLLPGLQIDISASDIREQIFGGLEANAREREFLPVPVSEYIRARGLYHSFAAT